MQRNILAILNPQCFKEKNYIAKFSTNLILKKIGKDNFENKT